MWQLVRQKLIDTLKWEMWFSLLRMSSLIMSIDLRRHATLRGASLLLSLFSSLLPLCLTCFILITNSSAGTSC